MITITLLGTAALLPLPERALTAATLSCAGHTILFDCGEWTQTEFAEDLQECAEIRYTFAGFDPGYGGMRQPAKGSEVPL